LANDAQRIDRMYRLAYGRPAEAEEITMGARFINDVSAEKAAPNQLSAWEQYAQVLLLGNEFAFVD
jgi:hypothetical protein